MGVGRVLVGQAAGADVVPGPVRIQARLQQRTVHRGRMGVAVNAAFQRQFEPLLPDRIGGKEHHPVVDAQLEAELLSLALRALRKTNPGMALRQPGQRGEDTLLRLASKPDFPGMKESGSQGISERGGVGGVIGESIFRQAVAVLAHLRSEPFRQLRRSSARHPGDSEHPGVDQIVEHMSAHAAGIVGGFSGFHRKIQIIPPVPAPFQIVRKRALLQKTAERTGIRIHRNLTSYLPIGSELKTISRTSTGLLPASMS